MSADFEASIVKTETHDFIYSSSLDFPNIMPGYGANVIMTNGNDSSATSSTSSSHTRLAGADDSGMSTLSNSGCMLTPTAGVMLNYGSPELHFKNADDFCDDLEPMIRNRSNTWPLRRTVLETNSQASPLMHDQIPEEE